MYLSSLINPIQLPPCSLPPTTCLDFIPHKGLSVKRQVGANLATQRGLRCLGAKERLSVHHCLDPIIPHSRPRLCPPCSAWSSHADDSEPFLMFGLTCRRLVRACDSGDRRGCSFLNTMSETRRQEAGTCSVLSAALGSHWLIF